jgi:hypothetical protein
MIKVNHKLPAGIERHGAELFEFKDDTLTKFVIVNNKLGYRAVTRLINTDESTSSLDDLFNAYVFDTGLGSSVMVQGKSV